MISERSAAEKTFNSSKREVLKIIFCCLVVKKNLAFHPLLGNTAIARGSSKLLLTRTLRLVPSRRATSIVLRPVSVQYIFRANQSTASPSVVFSPWLITVSMPLPSRFARLDDVKRGCFIKSLPFIPIVCSLKYLLDLILCKIKGSKKNEGYAPDYIQGDISIIKFSIHAVIVQRDDIVQLRHWYVHVCVVIGIQRYSSYTDAV